MIRRIALEGYKGRAQRGMRLEPLTLIIGNNGTGKSTVIEAVDFALGRPVCGSAADGADLRDALAGDRLAVEVEVATGLLTQHPPHHTIKRERLIDKDGTFKKSTLRFDDVGGGDALTRFAAALGDVSPPRGQTWLALSEDKLGAELAKLGADEVGVNKAIALVESFDAGLRKKVVGTTLPAQIAEARELAKGAVNAARAALKGIEGSTDRSRSAQAGDEAATPEKLIALKEALQRAENALEAAITDEISITSGGRKSREDLQRWTSTNDGLTADLARAQEAVSAARAALPADNELLSEDLKRAETKLADAKAAHLEIKGELEAAADGVAAARAKVATAQARVAAMDGIADALAGSSDDFARHCPMCEQQISLETARRLGAQLTARQRELGNAEQEQLAAIEYHNDVRGQVTAADREVTRCAEKVADFRVQRDDDARARLRLTAANERLQEVTARAEKWRSENPKPALVEDDPGLVEEAAQRTADARAAVQKARDEVTSTTAAAERYKRWRDDLKARKDAEDKVAAAEKLLEGVRGIEEGLLAAGAKRLVDGMLDYIPPTLGRPDVWQGQIGLRKDGEWIAGAGLSTAQQVTLAVAIDRSLDALTSRRLRIVSIEADALDPRSLDHLMAACESALAMGELDQAIIATCHAPSVVGPDWYVIRTSPDDTPPPSPPRGPKADHEDLLAPEAMSPATRAMLDPAAAPPMAMDVKVDPNLAPGTMEVRDPDGKVLTRFENIGQPSEPAQPRVIFEHGPNAGRALSADADPNVPAGETLGMDFPPLVEATAERPKALRDVEVKEIGIGPGGFGGEPRVINHLNITGVSMNTDGTMGIRGTAERREIILPEPTPPELLKRLTEPPEPPKTAAQEEQAAKTALRMLDGVGLTFEEVVAIIKPLSAEALRHLGVTRAGIAGTHRATPPLWRKAIAENFHKNGYDRDSICRWAKEASESFPKRSRGAGAPGDDKPDNEETGAEVAQEEGR